MNALEYHDAFISACERNERLEEEHDNLLDAYDRLEAAYEALGKSAMRLADETRRMQPYLVYRIIEEEKPLRRLYE